MDKSFARVPLAFTAARVFIFLDAAVWLVFAAITAFGAHPSYGGNIWLRWGFSAVSAGIGLGLISLAVLLRKRGRAIYTLTLAALTGLALANLFDQMGPVDYAVLAVALIPLVLLLLCRRWYFTRMDGRSKKGV